MLPSVDEAERLKKIIPGCRVRFFRENGHLLFLVISMTLCLSLSLDSSVLPPFVLFFHFIKTINGIYFQLFEFQAIFDLVSINVENIHKHIGSIKKGLCLFVTKNNSMWLNFLGFNNLILKNGGDYGFLQEGDFNLATLIRSTGSYRRKHKYDPVNDFVMFTRDEFQTLIYNHQLYAHCFWNPLLPNFLYMCLAQKG